MSRARLSVNINKIALLRNSRGRNEPSLAWAIEEAISAGAHGITVHPRLDQRHIKMEDVPAVGRYLRERHPSIEYNVECEDDPDLIDLVIKVRPTQCTLVPVGPGEITSDHGWHMPADVPRLRPTVARLQEAGIRVSLFADCDARKMLHFAETGADRVELYTGPYAWAWGTPGQERERALVWRAAEAARRVGLSVNAGHDLDRHNLVGIARIEGLAEVSIGHALIVRSLEVGLWRGTQELLMALGVVDPVEG